MENIYQFNGMMTPTSGVGAGYEGLLFSGQQQQQQSRDPSYTSLNSLQQQQQQQQRLDDTNLNDHIPSTLQMSMEDGANHHYGRGGGPSGARVQALRAISPPLQSKFSTPPPARSNSTPPGRHFGKYDEMDYANMGSDEDLMARQFAAFGLRDKVRKKIVIFFYYVFIYKLFVFFS